MDRREFLIGSGAFAAAVALPNIDASEPNRYLEVEAEILRQGYRMGRTKIYPYSNEAQAQADLNQFVASSSRMGDVILVRSRYVMSASPDWS